MRVQTLQRAYLPQLLGLVNLHLSAVVPGWALTGEFLAEHSKRDHTEPITDPWVVERATLCAFDGERMLAAAREQVSAWEMKREEVWGGGMFVAAFCEVPDCWPHVIKALEQAGYRPHAEHREALYGGTLDGVSVPGSPPLTDLVARRTVGSFGTRFSAILEEEEIGRCECVADLTHGGSLPALRGWAELSELWVREEWRNRSIGGWLVRCAVAWLRLAGCERIVLSVAEEDEAAGAGRFYRRFGWEVFAREIRSWTRD